MQGGEPGCVGDDFDGFFCVWGEGCIGGGGGRGEARDNGIEKRGIGPGRGSRVCEVEGLEEWFFFFSFFFFLVGWLRWWVGGYGGYGRIRGGGR